jgi:hypothetical protein
MPDNDIDAGPDDQGALPPAPTQTFTQDEVNRMLAREVVKVRREYANYPELKVAADELARLKEAQKSDEQRLNERATRAEQERDRALSRARDQMVRVAIVAEAARQGATDPEDIPRYADEMDLVITDDGVDGVREAVELLLARKRYLVAGRRRGGSELRGTGNVTAASAQLTRSQIRAWSHGEDGGMTPERIALIEQAHKAGTIDASR